MGGIKDYEGLPKWSLIVLTEQRDNVVLLIFYILNGLHDRITFPFSISFTVLYDRDRVLETDIREAYVAKRGRPEVAVGISHFEPSLRHDFMHASTYRKTIVFIEKGK